MDEPKCEQIGMLTGGKWNKCHDIGRRVYDINGIAPTMHTCGGGNLEPKILITEASKKGYDTATCGDSINMAYPNSKTRRGRVGHGVAQTLTTGDAQQVVVEPIIYDDYNGRIRADQDCIGALTTNCGESSLRSGVKIIEPRIAAMRGRNPDNPSDRTAGSPTEQRLEIGSEETSNTLTTVQKDNLVVEPRYRIRKLTERECFRLMGVKQEDFNRVAKIQSISSLYHLAGDSIVTTCLIAIVGALLSVDYTTIINELIKELMQ